MGKILVRNAVQRKAGHLYYVDGAGNVCEAKMARGGKKKKTVKKKTTARKTATKRKTTARKTATKRKTTRRRR